MIRRDSWTDYTHPDWTGETVFVLGGGPSLLGFDAERLRGHGRVIAVNEAGLTLCPWADVLFWSDIRWVDWNLERIALHTGEYRYTNQTYGIERIPRARLVKWRPQDAWCFEHDTIAGLDSGGRCINLAHHLGARRAVLLGFDMRDYALENWRDGNWHDKHPEPPLPDQRAERFIPAHARMAAALRALDFGIDFEVLNATPGSALTCWPKRELENLL